MWLAAQNLKNFVNAARVTDTPGVQITNRKSEITNQKSQITNLQTAYPENINALAMPA
jgi:hypothetical protein